MLVFERNQWHQGIPTFELVIFSGLNGAGACMEGGVRGPASGVCQPNTNITFGSDTDAIEALPNKDQFEKDQVIIGAPHLYLCFRSTSI